MSASASMSAIRVMNLWITSGGLEAPQGQRRRGRGTLLPLRHDVDEQQHILISILSTNAMAVIACLAKSVGVCEAMGSNRSSLEWLMSDVAGRA